MMPRVSVIMGIYNSKKDTKDVERSIDSIIKQSFTDFEFLICDDGSVESTIRLLDNYARLDSRIRLIRMGHYSSHAKKLNECLRSSVGKYIARQDADDYSTEQRFEKQIEQLLYKSNIAFVGCNASLFCNNKIFGETSFPAEPRKEDFLFTQPFLHPTLMFRKTAICAVGGYDEQKRTVLYEDYDLLLRMYEIQLYGYNLSEKLFFYQMGEDYYQKRKYYHRLNESIIRYKRFKSLDMMPRALPYVIKPLVVGLIPPRILREIIKKTRRK